MARQTTLLEPPLLFKGGEGGGKISPIESSIRNEPVSLFPLSLQYIEI